MMKRSLKFSLLGNTNKLRQLERLWLEYRKALRYFLKRLFSGKDLSENFVKSFETPLSYRYKQCVKRQAFKMFKSWCRNRNKGNKPSLRNPCMVVDYRFITVEQGRTKRFDYWAHIATLEKGNRIVVPFKSYDHAREYFEQWRLISGGRLIKRNALWILELNFEKETPPEKTEGKEVGMDIGIKKLIVDSDGNRYGEKIEGLMNKIHGKKQGSNSFKKALRERDYYINQELRTIPFGDIKTIVLKNIKSIKKNTKKEKRLHKEFRSKLQRWVYARLIRRIRQSAEVSGVHIRLINPSYTSQICSRCKYAHKSNRRGEMFRCKNCGYTMDADSNASLNILNLGLTRQAMVAGSA